MTDHTTDTEKPNRAKIPYGRQSIDESDIEAVVEVLRSDWLTTGPKVGEFEQVFAQATGAEHAVAVSSGTAALHAAMHALNIGPGDEVIVPTMTFVASANCVVYQGGTPVFCDVEPDSLLIDPGEVENLITARTRAIVAVDYAGHSCDYDALQRIADQNGVAIVADACHSLGGEHKGQSVGSLADLSAFSFHPVKNMTTGEGGMITTDNPELAASMRQFRNHGIVTDHREREEKGTWVYDMADLGYNYRMTDLQCALGVSQLRKLPEFVEKRQQIAAAYDSGFADIPTVTPLGVRPDIRHAYHLYVVRLSEELDRKVIFKGLRQRGIYVNVHYSPVHLHSFYSKTQGGHKGQCPVAEKAGEQILSLPMYPGLKPKLRQVVIQSVREVIQEAGS